MRPTYLNFRSPKEQTGEMLKPSVTYRGSSIEGNEDFNKSKTIFPRSERFQHIAERVNRTSYRVGPGCYDIPLSTNNRIGPRLLRESVVKEGMFDYSYVGNLIVKQPNVWKAGYTNQANNSLNHSVLLNDSKKFDDGGSPKSYKQSSDKSRRGFRSVDRSAKKSLDSSMDNQQGRF